MAKTARAVQRVSTTPSPISGGSGGRSPAEAVRAFAESFFVGAGPALITVLNRAVTVKVLGADLVSPGDVPTRIVRPWVVVKVPYTRGLDGTHGLILAMPDALAFARVLGGDAETPGEWLPTHDEALRETVNQVLFSAASTLMPLLGRSPTFGPAGVTVVDDEDSLPSDLGGEGGTLVWLVRAEVADTAGFRIEVALTVGHDLTREITAIVNEVGGPGPGAGAATFEPEAGRAEAGPSRLDLILDIALPVTVELGRTRMQIQDILKLAPGSVIELEKSAGDPVELFINDRAIARGEVVVIDENFGVRLTSIVAAADRIKTLR